MNQQAFSFIAVNKYTIYIIYKNNMIHTSIALVMFILYIDGSRDGLFISYHIKNFLYHVFSIWRLLFNIALVSKNNRLQRGIEGIKKGTLKKTNFELRIGGNRLGIVIMNILDETF